MAQILAPSTQWQMSMPKNSSVASPMITKMWGTLLMKQNKKGTIRSSAKFRVLALKFDNSTVNRIEDLLNLDITPYTDKIIAEYIWIGGSIIDMTRSKPVEHPSELSNMTDQVLDRHLVKIVNPQGIFKDHFCGGNNILVIGDFYTQQVSPSPQTNAMRPYYCGAGAVKSFGRDISDARYKACLYAGINISGTNGEVMPGQRITEQGGVVLLLDPKPIEGDWNGAGCHANYSTKIMREDGGYEAIKKAILNLSLRLKEHISAYGEGNERKLIGKHETASIDSFSWGVANRGCLIRVGRETEKQCKGYLEDRLPSSNMDPYIVTSLLA